jgi:segregation and condensation protein A
MDVELRLDKFSGPLDLLLTLIQEEKLDIAEISLANVTEQFLRYLDTLEERRAEELADFLVIGSRLLLLKSRMLLPQFSPPEEEDGPSLADQLRLYKQFAEAAKRLNRRWMKGERAVFRAEPPRKPEGFVPPVNVALSTLHERMVQLVARLTPPTPLPETRMDKAISMKEKLDEIRRMLARAKSASFHDLLRDAKNRTEIIVSFLAVLELVKQKLAAVRQEDEFGDIIVERAEYVA